MHRCWENQYATRSGSAVVPCVEMLMNSLHVRECLRHRSCGVARKLERYQSDHAPTVTCKIPSCNVNRLFSTALCLKNACHWASVSFLAPGLGIVRNTLIKVCLMNGIGVGCHLSFRHFASFRHLCQFIIRVIRVMRVISSFVSCA